MAEIPAAGASLRAGSALNVLAHEPPCECAGRACVIRQYLPNLYNGFCCCLAGYRHRLIKFRIKIPLFPLAYRFVYVPENFLFIFLLDGTESVTENLWRASFFLSPRVPYKDQPSKCGYYAKWINYWDRESQGDPLDGRRKRDKEISCLCTYFSCNSSAQSCRELCLFVCVKRKQFVKIVLQDEQQRSQRLRIQRKFSAMPFSSRHPIYFL